jgi:hypothetical protein
MLILRKTKKKIANEILPFRERGERMVINALWRIKSQKRLTDSIRIPINIASGLSIFRRIRIADPMLPKIATVLSKSFDRCIFMNSWQLSALLKDNFHHWNTPEV